MERKHFIEEKSLSIVRVLIATLLLLPTLGATFWLMYEYFYVEHYWVNRWRLNRYIDNGMVELSNHSTHRDIDIYTLKIEGVEYSLWLWGDNYMSLGDYDSPTKDYIGLFKGSLMSSWLTKKIIKKLRYKINGTQH